MISLDNMPDLMTVGQTKEVFGLKTEQTVYRWIWKGVLESVKIGRMVRVKKSSVQSILSQTGEQKSSIFKEGNPRRLSPAPQKRRKLEWEL